MANDNNKPYLVDAYGNYFDVPIELIPTSMPGLNFGNHYAANKGTILRCSGFTLDEEDGVEISDHPLWFGLRVSNGEGNEYHPGAVKIPFDTLEKLGYKIGDMINKVNIYLEPSDSALKIYVERQTHHEIPPEEARRICEEIDRDLAD